eukprot:TRINITY_DN4575_c0_g1_i1.p1 TRINITY_DN4575_c0_g1~~TRINITY_DN4575_c0_g1_i1.p1  ORF type:complete len:303 (-),score=72.34 TRINITY_DN4575_c0_g1_i1:129-1016(-)
MATPAPAEQAPQISQIEQQIIAVCQNHPKGIGSEALRKALPAISLEVIGSALNSLLKKEALDIGQEGGATIFKLKDQAEAARFRGLSHDHRLVYQIIEESGTEGMWIKNIKNRSKLQPQKLNKILETLETRKLIKTVKKSSGAKKKIYMLFELEPAEDAGNSVPWDGENGFDQEFCDVLSHQCYNFISKKGFASVEELVGHIKQSGISKVDLDSSHIQSLIEALIYDGKIEELHDPRASQRIGMKRILYKPTKLEPPRNGLTDVPCGICPVINLCSDDGLISPTTCIYLHDWMEF